MKKIYPLVWKDSKQYLKIAWILLLIVAVIVAMPLRWLSHLIIGQSDVNKEEETKYSDVALKFSSDYDKANPLTRQKGLDRLHKLQIDKMKENG